MKFCTALLASTFAGSAVAFCGTAPPLAFSTSTTISAKQQLPSLVVLEASRQKQKKASRQKWIEARGIMGFSATSTGSTAVAATEAPGLFKSEEGLEYIRLVHPKSGSSSVVYLYGGLVTSFVHEGVEYIAVRPDAKMDGSKPISGGLSHCWPQFGPGAIQQHGFARNVNWVVKSMTDTSVTLELAPNDYTKAMWDKAFLCTFTVTVDENKLDTRLVVENKGTDAFDFQSALHSYFTVSALDNLEIRGSFENKQFLNKLAGDGGEMQTETRSAITITEEYDRVYKGVNDPVLADKGTGKALTILNAAGYEDTVLWNPYGNEGMGYNNFVCVESVKFDPVTLAGGESWTGDMSLIPGNL